MLFYFSKKHGTNKAVTQTIKFAHGWFTTAKIMAQMLEQFSTLSIFKKQHLLND